MNRLPMSQSLPTFAQQKSFNQIHPSDSMGQGYGGNGQNDQASGHPQLYDSMKQMYGQQQTNQF